MQTSKSVLVERTQEFDLFLNKDHIREQTSLLCKSVKLHLKNHDGNVKRSIILMMKSFRGILFSSQSPDPFHESLNENGDLFADFGPR